MTIGIKTDMIVLPMQLAHLEPLLRLHKQTYAKAQQEKREMFLNIIKANGSICLIGALDGKLIGYAMGYPSEENRSDYDLGPDLIKGDEKAIFLHDLLIHPKVHGVKYPIEMLDEFKIKAREAGFEKIITITYSGSFPFWSSQHFENLREMEYKGQPAFYMQLDLSKIYDE